MKRGMKAGFSYKDNPDYVKVTIPYGDKGATISRYVKREEAAKHDPAALISGGDEVKPREYDPLNPDRMHEHPGYVGQHKVAEVHPDDLAAIEHRDEIENYSKKLYGEPKKDWMNKLGVNFKEVDENTQKYSKPGVPSAFFVDLGYRFGIAIPDKGVHKFFPKERDAINYLQSYFTSGQIMKSIEGFIQKAAMFDKIDSLIKAPPEERVFSSYKTGSTEIKLKTEDDDKYKVLVNGSVVLETDNLKAAIAKYYREMANLIDAQTEDKDIALDLFGEKVIQMNRHALPLLAKLGKDEEASWLKNMDFSELSLEKMYPSAATAHGLPMPQDMGQGTSEIGVTPSGPDTRNAVQENSANVKGLDLNRSKPSGMKEDKSKSKGRLSSTSSKKPLENDSSGFGKVSPQAPIEETGDATIDPASFMKQHSNYGMQPSPDDLGKDGKREIEKPVPINRKEEIDYIYDQPEQKPIMANSFDDFMQLAKRVAEQNKYPDRMYEGEQAVIDYSHFDPPNRNGESTKPIDLKSRIDKMIEKLSKAK